tara:strand:- start:52 stop:744 length:693 start_codon:yes stop_codon:yes gene_type:complete
MLKIKTLFVALIASVFALNAMAQTVSMGLTASAMYYDADGHEKMKSSANKTSKSSSGAAPFASIFLEVDLDNGTTVGVDVIPYSSKIGDGSNSVPDTDTDDLSDSAGTNKVDVNLANAVTLYLEQEVDIPGLDTLGSPYVKIGYSQMELETDESVQTGSTYGDETMSGYHLGLGVRGDLDSGGFWKTALTAAIYDGASFVGSQDTDSVSNTIELEDFNTVTLSFSIGQSF